MKECHPLKCCAIYVAQAGRHAFTARARDPLAQRAVTRGLRGRRCGCLASRPALHGGPHAAEGRCPVQAQRERSDALRRKAEEAEAAAAELRRAATARQAARAAARGAADAAAAALEALAARRADVLSAAAMEQARLAPVPPGAPEGHVPLSTLLDAHLRMFQSEEGRKTRVHVPGMHSARPCCVPHMLCLCSSHLSASRTTGCARRAFKACNALSR